jgi:hypothetical protein
MKQLNQKLAFFQEISIAAMIQFNISEHKTISFSPKKKNAICSFFSQNTVLQQSAHFRLKNILLIRTKATESKASNQNKAKGNHRTQYYDNQLIFNLKK